MGYPGARLGGDRRRSATRRTYCFCSDLSPCPHIQLHPGPSPQRRTLQVRASAEPEAPKGQELEVRLCAAACSILTVVVSIACASCTPPRAPPPLATSHCNRSYDPRPPLLKPTEPRQRSGKEEGGGGAPARG